MKREPKELDVYFFKYNKEEIEIDSYINRCFDGILITRKDGDDFYLQDTYSSDGRVFKIKEAERKGELEFVCNLDKVSKIDIREVVYYKDEDIIILHCHKGYQTSHYLKAGAEKCPIQMKQYINKQIEEKQNTINFLERDIELYKEKLDKIDNGDIDIYI